PLNTYVPRRLFPAASKPPITYRAWSFAAAAVSSMATGSRASSRWTGPDGDGADEADGEAATGGVRVASGDGAGAGEEPAHADTTSVVATAVMTLNRPGIQAHHVRLGGEADG